MFGQCVAPPSNLTSINQNEYSCHRGRFYLFWNALKSSGRPMLVALLAGDAAMETEGKEPPGVHSTTHLSNGTKATPMRINDDTISVLNGTNGNNTPASTTSSTSSSSPSPHESTLLTQCLSTLRTIFALPATPSLTEAIITRWRSDPFARGTYSYLGPDAQPGDYEAMARGVGNLHFAGEATCGTHPATVHGAFLSGLRAAGECVEDMIGGVVVTPVK